jgi:purine-binding chemotaxis protein CheW
MAVTRPAGISTANTVPLLAFRVGEQTYGLPVTAVVRIIEMVTITRLPEGIGPIRGVINMQGKAVPVMDLRHRFGLPAQAYGLHTPIVLVDISGDSRLLGLIVDAVEDVLHVPYDGLESTEIFTPPELAGPMATQASLLSGAATLNGRMILVFNVRALLTSLEQNQLSEALADQGSD